MISYKKIDISKIKLDDNIISYNDQELVIKSPIINFKIVKVENNNKIKLLCNDDSQIHDIFLNIIGYIERIYDYNKIKTNFISNNNIIVCVNETSRFFDVNTKEIDIENIIGDKCIVSLTFINKSLVLTQLLLIK
tara:strand:+ start:2463 stop:2867 length:405 start_codon:yes stop_codon:yes gene_type:complete